MGVPLKGVVVPVSHVRLREQIRVLIRPGRLNLVVPPEGVPLLIVLYDCLWGGSVRERMDGVEENRRCGSRFGRESVGGLCRNLASANSTEVVAFFSPTIAMTRS